MPDTTRTERSLEWVQRAKARALVDVVGGISQPAHLLAALAQYPAAASLLAQERELIARLHRVPASERAKVYATPYLATDAERTGAGRLS